MIDLHTHSSASDGSDTPSALVSHAVEIGLHGIALTDHDTVSGIAEFLEAASGRIRAVPGLEISTSLYNKEIHILGLFVDPASEKLGEFLSLARDRRNERNKTILQKLNAMNYEISQKELEESAGGESVGRPHFARILVEKGYFESSQDVFDKCLKRGARAYTPRILPTPSESIDAIHEAGGLAVWAHPVYRSAGERAFVRKYLKKLVQFGLDGVEAYYSLYSPAQHAMLMEASVEHGILVSGGSDYHGENQNSVKLGSGGGSLAVPDAVLDCLEQAWKERNP